MSLPAARRWAFRGAGAVLASTALAAGLQFAAGASAATNSHVASASSHTAIPRAVIARMYSAADPYSPAYKHPYRHGVLPTRSQFAKMRAWALKHPGANPALNSSALSFGGDVDGIGVTDGPEKVYIVFWGSQWGSQGTNSQGNITLSNDSNGAAPYLQQLFKGLGQF